MIEKNKKVVIIIPTYNESENIGDLLNLIEGTTENIKDYDISILIVDDNSPDGTSAIVKNLNKNNIFLLKRNSKRGLGSAYIDGFEYAINNLNAEIIFEMDGDFSHNPEDIEKFLREIENGYDLVIGSRYIEGGSIAGLELHRRIISILGNLIARIVLKLNVRDCSSGYRAIKTSILRRIDLDKINVKGYAFQVFLLYLIMKMNVNIKEIPIVFYKRRAGKSKFRFMDIFVDIWRVIISIIKIKILCAF
ncbi:MAG: polyprenol monophosphomannose synthase [Candidatus Altiarchaeales archaeon]|nr:MAG: polyprenol monophosphomannose synthase [Candidatus Altiarchaeales archaeon]